MSLFFFSLSLSLVLLSLSFVFSLSLSFPLLLNVGKQCVGQRECGDKGGGKYRGGGAAAGVESRRGARRHLSTQPGAEPNALEGYTRSLDREASISISFHIYNVPDFHGYKLNRTQSFIQCI